MNPIFKYLYAFKKHKKAENFKLSADKNKVINKLIKNCYFFNNISNLTLTFLWVDTSIDIGKINMFEKQLKL